MAAIKGTISEDGISHYLFLTFCSSPSRINGCFAAVGQKIALKGSEALWYKGHGHRVTEAKLNYSYKQQYGDLASVWQVLS